MQELEFVIVVVVLISFMCLVLTGAFVHAVTVWLDERVVISF